MDSVKLTLGTEFMNERDQVGKSFEKGSDAMSDADLLLLIRRIGWIAYEVLWSRMMGVHGC